MFAQFRPALVMLIVMTALTGAIYPAAVTGIAQVLFLIDQDGKAVGSALIGQAFSDPKHFWSRPSATSPYPNNAAASSGSNQGPLNPALSDAVEGRVKALREADPGNTAAVPVDLVTASASGLDPHISPAAAEFQVNRVARTRGVDAAVVRNLVSEHIEQRQWGFLGEPRVNVLRLNLALDAAMAK